jgi:hypothetical protein
MHDLINPYTALQRAVRPSVPAGAANSITDAYAQHSLAAGCYHNQQLAVLQAAQPRNLTWPAIGLQTTQTGVDVQMQYLVPVPNNKICACSQRAQRQNPTQPRKTKVLLMLQEYANSCLTIGSAGNRKRQPPLYTCMMLVSQLRGQL